MKMEMVSGKDEDEDVIDLKYTFKPTNTKNQRRWNLPCCRCLNEEGFWERKIVN
jgi:hypothetical protein